ncbi:MAG: hypothetical protein ACP5IL_12330 [Syntrophobacteraceae bacterium]
MDENDSLKYLLFPHLTLFPNAAENLSLFLPRLGVLEILSPALVPQWAKNWLFPHPVINDSEMASLIGAGLAAYREFATVHEGPGGILGFIKQSMEESEAPRYRIQEQLRGKSPFSREGEKNEILQASLLLEMARELDDRQLEIAAGFERSNTIEQEFRDILGIEDEESQLVATNLSSALVADENSLLYMLEKRIQSWFKVMSAAPAPNRPVFVSGFPEVAEDILDRIAAGCARNGQDFTTDSFELGPVPWPAGGTAALLTEPGVRELVATCRRGLDDFLRNAAQGAGPEQTQGKRLILQSSFEELCSGCGVSKDARATICVTVVKNVVVSAIPGFPPLGPNAEVGTWPPIFLCVDAGRKN